MTTPASITSILRILAVASVLATGCSSDTDSVERDRTVCQACATAGSGGTASGGSSPSESGGASTVGLLGGSASTGGTEATGGSRNTDAGGASNNPARCSSVTGSVAQTLVAEGAILLDVRTVDEFSSNGLPGAINIPLAELATRMSELDSSKRFVVYCASGNRSGQAISQLCDAGYDVFDLGARSNWPQ